MVGLVSTAGSTPHAGIGAPGAAHGRRILTVDLDEFPRIGHPAIRALREAGYRSLRQLAGVPQQQLAQLDNVGPKSLHAIQAALQQHGYTLG